MQRTRTYNPGERAITEGLLGAGTGAVIGAIAAGGHGAGIGAAVGGGLGTVASVATRPTRPPRHAYRRHYYLGEYRNRSGAPPPRTRGAEEQT